MNNRTPVGLPSIALVLALTLTSSPTAAQRRRSAPRVSPALAELAIADADGAEFDGMIASLADSERLTGERPIRALRAPGGQAARAAASVGADFDVELELTGGAELGYIPEPAQHRWWYGGMGTRREYDRWTRRTNYEWRRLGRTNPVVGPPGTLRLFLGLGLPRFDGGRARIAVGYAGSVSVGPEDPTRPEAVFVLQRHGLGVTMRARHFVVGASFGCAYATFIDPTWAESALGWSAELQPGVAFGGFVMRFPVGVDVWTPGDQVIAHAGVTLGGTTL